MEFSSTRQTDVLLNAPHFHDVAAAYADLEATLSLHDPVCPRCGAIHRITPVKGGQIGLYRRGSCKRRFTVKVGTVYECSHGPLNLWLQAVHTPHQEGNRSH